ncbi:MAG: prolyl oligopeptidase family serine peptidase [Bacteroidetes bacterium]|nr:prolyl oligopeptidase family serine peptidase [Bacteroidota bacterium]
MTLKISLFLWVLLIAMNMQAQQQGNVVEYFGKERVETTDEGHVLHRFHQGLMLNGAIRPGMLMGNQDVVLWLMATGQRKQPAAGEELIAGFPQRQDTLRWEAVRADSNHLFTGMQRGWLYAEFESAERQIVLLEATGHTMALINGLPYEGDHYDYGYTLHPVELKQGINTFLFSYGRFQRLKAALVIPSQPVMLLRRDMTLPTVLKGAHMPLHAAIRVLNATRDELSGLKMKVMLASGEELVSPLLHVPAMSQRKLPFLVPAPLQLPEIDKVEARLQLLDAHNQMLHQIDVMLKVQDARTYHERTFVSQIDGSVQYFSVLPSLSDSAAQPLVLSLHGASVEATNQIRAYKPKSWAHIVAPTNRRPFGFNWEDWGRLDAFEVLDQARRLWQTDSLRTYVTGHSMGGHGTWVMGGTYPGMFAAMAPAAGYPDIIAYRRTGSDTAFFDHPHYQMLYRSALHARMTAFTENYVQTPLYVLHGDADEVVPVTQARSMRDILAPLHRHMAYYEHPGGTHWYGDESMDWPPLFEFLRRHKMKPVSERDTLVLLTANIGVNATNAWLTIGQQQQNGMMSRAEAIRSPKSLEIKTANVRRLALSDEAFGTLQVKQVTIDGQKVSTGTKYFYFDGKRWKPTDNIPENEKHPGRNGGFKTAFEKRFVLVYGTGGSEEMQEWNRRRALFDAETFLYRANGAPEVLADTLFDEKQFAGRNIILYGNAETNRAWNKLLSDAPLQAGEGYVQVGRQRFEGDDLGFYAVFPLKGTNDNLIGIVGGSGLTGLKAAVQNHYFSGITAFPDLMIFKAGWLLNGLEDMRMSGFFGPDWGVDSGSWTLSKP